MLNNVRNIWQQQIAVAAQDPQFQACNLQGLSAVIHNATWCPDCEREVSQLLAIDKQAKSGFEKIDLHSYEDKAAYREGKQASSLPISCLPTIIFYRDNQEVYRIEEDSNGEMATKLALI